MTENVLPTLKRRRSIEEKQPDDCVSTQVLEVDEDHESDLQTEFLDELANARSGFWEVKVLIVIGLVFGILGLFGAVQGFETGVLFFVAIVCVLVALLRFVFSIIEELRGSYEAGVLAILKAIEEKDR